VCYNCQSGRHIGGKANARKVKSREIVDDVASDESSKEKDDTGVGGGVTDSSKRKRQSLKSKTSAVDKDNKLHRKRTAKNKVCKNILVCINSCLSDAIWLLMKS